MPKNQVQFQKGLSIPAFLERYGSEPQCEQALFAARWPQGFQCPLCGYAKHCRLHTRKVLQCVRCKHQTSLTAGTLFEHTKLPLRTWYLALYLVTQSKNGISAMELKRQLGVSYNTAWLLKHKLMQAMRERDDSQPLLGTVELDDAYLGGEAPAGGKTPFVAAGAAAAEPGAGFPKGGAGTLGARASAARDGGAQRRAALLPRGAGGRLRAPAARHRRWQGQLRDPRPGLGEHPAGQRQALDRRDLPRLLLALRRTLPRRVRLPLQPPLPTG